MSAAESTVRFEAKAASPCGQAFDEEATREQALEACNRRFAALRPEERAEWAFENLPGTHVLTSSFGAQAAVSLHPR